MLDALAHGADAETVLAEAARVGGAWIDPDPDAPDHRIVTVVRRFEHEDESAVLLIDTVTHLHRADLSPFVLDRVEHDGIRLHAGAFSLPATLRATVALLVERPLDPELGATRERWRPVYDRTESLPGGGEVCVTAGGGRSSILSLPDALPQRFVHADSPEDPAPAGTLHRGRLDSQVLGFPLDVWCHLPAGAAEHGVAGVAILSDGDRLTAEVPLFPALDRAAAHGALAPTATVLYATVDPADRPRALGMNPALADFLTDELLPWAGTFATLPTDPARRVVGGASLGGLAAADLVRRAPHVARNAIVQSGSFWWPDPAGGAAPGEQLELWRDGGSAAGIRIFQEVGEFEGHLLGLNREFRVLAEAAGAEVQYREYCGGHDFACWRVGLVDGLVALLGGEASGAPARRD
ncbi:alpha/beta hydrolase-fold protein [Leucobacter sp. HNU]|uniref:alpha/beta hydrolase-fold protein n=1 Tax=Leucobacter sp. HNU TaxID=3236805 RepID=UPI003A802D0E